MKQQRTREEVKALLLAGAYFVLKGESKDAIFLISFFDKEGNINKYGKEYSDDPQWLDIWVTKLIEEQTQIIIH